MKTKSKSRTINAILPWFGGKRTLAPKIVELLGPHTQYFEPFCGSMAVLFAKEASQKETVCDLHGDLINLARVLQRRDLAEELYDRCARTLVSEQLIDDAKLFLGDHPFIDMEADPEGDYVTLPVDSGRAYWYVVASWIGRNGTAGVSRQDFQIAVRWTNSGGSPTARWNNVVESMPWWHRRLRNVVILKRNSFDILHRFEDAPPTAIYVDPPYFPDGDARTGIKSSGDKSHQYKHELNYVPQKTNDWLFDGEQQCDHERLRDILESYQHARIVVSYYDCADVRRLYHEDKWEYHDCTRAKHLMNVGGRSVKKAPEVLLVKRQGR